MTAASADVLAVPERTEPGLRLELLLGEPRLLRWPVVDDRAVIGHRWVSGAAQVVEFDRREHSDLIGDVVDRVPHPVRRATRLQDGFSDRFHVGIRAADHRLLKELGLPAVRVLQVEALMLVVRI